MQSKVYSNSNPGHKQSARSYPLGTLVRKVSIGSTGGFKRTRNLTVRKAKLTKAEIEERAIASRARRFQLQSEAAALLPGEKVATCQREIVPVAAGVAIQHSPANKSAHYAGLKTCSSVWHCPVCAAKISERRRVELEKVIKQHIALGGSVYMTTYTISHHRHNNLPDLLDSFLRARKRMKQGRRGVALREDYQIAGTVSVLEVTWSEENGWHPHVHELVFCMLPELDASRYEHEMREAWRAAAQKEGLKMNEHGFKLDRTYGAVADYIAKYGREPERTPWGVETELTKAHIKQGRMAQHYTPFALLAAIADGRDDLKPVFTEYATWFKGRKQLNYSAHLKSFYDLEEKTDEELASEQEEDAVTLVMLDRDQWAAVVANDIRSEVLEIARSGDAEKVVAYLAEFGIEASPFTPPEYLE